jgi:biotin operon repressor
MFSVEGEVVSNNGLSRLLNITGTAIRKLIVALEKRDW